MSSRLAGVSLHLVRTTDDAMEFKRWLGERHENDAVAVDTETTGLDPYERDAAIRLCQFGDTRTGWAIPWADWRGVCAEALNQFEGDFIYHNIGFDARWIERHLPDYRVPWHRAHDTMIQAHLDNPADSVALKNLSVRHIDRKANSGEYLLKESMHRNKWTWATVPVDFDQYWAYAALDTVLTANLHDIFQIQQRYREAYELELAVRRITLAMEQCGSPIDVEYCERKYRELNEYVEACKKWGKENLGISIGSSQQLVKWFMANGGEITEFTPQGAPSANKDQLKKFAAESGRIGEVAAWVLKVRKADKLAGTYFLNLIEGNRNGVVHPSIRTLGARTSRMSISNPALQTLPKGEATVRTAFIPREGDRIMSCDLSQVEFRMFASLSQDEELISLFRMADDTDSDVFTEIGREVYSDPSMTKKDKRRKLIKGMIYGRLYGAGVAKQALTAGVSQDQMQIVADKFDSLYPGVKQFQGDLEATILDRLNNEGEAYVLLPTGRKLPVDRDKMYVGVNYTVQGGAAEVFKRNLVQLDLAGLGSNMLVPVHDEIVLSVSDADLAETAKIVQECMTTVQGWSVPLLAGEPTWGSNWGELVD